MSSGAQSIGSLSFGNVPLAPGAAAVHCHRSSVAIVCLEPSAHTARISTESAASPPAAPLAAVTVTSLSP